MKIKRALLVFVCLIIAAASLSACVFKNYGEPQTQAKSFYEYFDTVSVVFSYKGDAPDAFEANCAAIEELLNKYHKLFDIYYE